MPVGVSSRSKSRKCSLVARGVTSSPGRAKHGPFLDFFESNESNILSTLTSRLRDRIRSRHWRRFSVKKTRFKIVPSTELPSTSIISTDEVKTKNLSPRFLDYEDSVNG